MRVLVWQWGRRGGAPRFAASLVRGLAALDGVEPQLSLSTEAELMHSADAPRCDLPVGTYHNLGGFLWRVVQAPVTVGRLVGALRRLRSDIAVCALPGPLDLLMIMALRCLGVPAVVIVHDADAHPGDRTPLLFRLQRSLIGRADAVIVLSDHVAQGLRRQAAMRPDVRLAVAAHPPYDFGVTTPPGAHAGPRRVLIFGRLLPYKGLDLLADALRLLGPRFDLVVRVVGQGPETAALAALRALPGVSVENRWVPEDEVGALLEWSDIVVLPYREASQSGVAAAALAAGRCVVATEVGGLVEQLGREPQATLCAPEPRSLATALDAAVTHPPGPNATVRRGGEGWTQLGRTVLASLAPIGG